MPGAQIVIPSMPSTIPVASLIDPMINVGTLFAFDPAHSADPVSGVPASSSLIPNLAWRQCAAILGSGTRASLAGLCTTSGLTGSSGRLERSTKGGIHVLCSQTALAANAGFYIALPDAIKTRLLTNRNIAISRVQRVTRAAVTPPAAPIRGLVLASDPLSIATNYLAQLYVSGSGALVAAPTTAPALLGATLIPDTGAAGELAEVGVSQWTGTVPSSASAMLAGLFVGRVPDATVNPGSTAQQHPSAVLYRWIIEDLDVSGRSFSAFTAASQAWFATNVRTVGGRFYGDTVPTAPSTIP